MAQAVSDTQNRTIVGALIEELVPQKERFRMIVGEDLTGEQLTFHIGSSRSNIIFLAGHLLSAQEAMNHALGQGMDLPEGWAERFGMGVGPSDKPEDYPAISEVLDRWDAAIDRSVAALEKMSDADLATPLPEGSPLASLFGTVGEALNLGPFHFAYHLGQIALLRKAQGLPAGFGV